MKYFEGKTFISLQLIFHRLLHFFKKKKFFSSAPCGKEKKLNKAYKLLRKEIKMNMSKVFYCFARQVYERTIIKSGKNKLKISFTFLLRSNLRTWKGWHYYYTFIVELRDGISCRDAIFSKI